MAIKDVATPEEVLEAELVIIQAAGLIVKHMGYQKDGNGGGVHLYDILAPQLKGFPLNGSMNGYPTKTLDGLREMGLIK